MLIVTSLCEEKFALGNGGMEIMACGNLGWVALKVFAYWRGSEMLNYHLWCSICPSCRPCNFRNISFNHTLPLHITKESWKITNHLKDGEISKLAIWGDNMKNIPFPWIYFYMLSKAISEFHGNMNIYGHTIIFTFLILISFILVILFTGFHINSNIRSESHC